MAFVKRLHAYFNREVPVTLAENSWAEKPVFLQKGSK